MPDDLRGVLPNEVLDQLLAGAKTEDEIVGPGGLLSQLTKRLVERLCQLDGTRRPSSRERGHPTGARADGCFR